MAKLKFLFITFVFCSAALIWPKHVLGQSTKVDMFDDRFEPTQITVKQGEEIEFINKGKELHWPASNFHPTHELYPEFDPKKGIKPGESWKFRFGKSGMWRFHDHLYPHIHGTITVAGTPKKSIIDNFIEYFSRIKDFLSAHFGSGKSQSIESGDRLADFEVLTEKEQYDELNALIKAKGVEAAWKFVKDRFSKRLGSNVHDLAHFLGKRIFEEKGMTGIDICDASFAFGCYHGFADVAFGKGLGVIGELEKSCEKVGPVNSGPWASCVHGIGHGIATFFDTADFTKSLEACELLAAGQNYCQDGVFMEFADSAAQSIYRMDDPLYPCDTLESKFQQACGRNQPTVMSKFFKMNFGDIAANCLVSKDETFKHFCIDALGLRAGQSSSGTAANILSQCAEIKDKDFEAQCVSAAAGELVFQNYSGWEAESALACQKLPSEYRNSCQKRVQEVVDSYRRKS